MLRHKPKQPLGPCCTTGLKFSKGSTRNMARAGHGFTGRVFETRNCANYLHGRCAAMAASQLAR